MLAVADPVVVFWGLLLELRQDSQALNLQLTVILEEQALGQVVLVAVLEAVHLAVEPDGLVIKAVLAVDRVVLQIVLGQVLLAQLAGELPGIKLVVAARQE